jgi:hypothetical protein
VSQRARGPYDCFDASSRLNRALTLSLNAAISGGIRAIGAAMASLRAARENCPARLADLHFEVAL